MDRFVETHFEPKQLIYIAVDGDNAGQLLQQELIRRLGAERCHLVHFGPECKDANEHLIRYGPKAFSLPWHKLKKSRWKVSSPPQIVLTICVLSSKTACNEVLKQAGAIWMKTVPSKPVVSW